MLIKKLLTVLLGLAFLCSCSSNSKEEPAVMKEIPIYGNTYIIGDQRFSINIGEDGITGWSDPSVQYSSWFKVTNKGSLKVYLQAKTTEQSNIKVTIDGQPFNVEIGNKQWERITVGEIVVDTPGYIRIDFNALDKEGAVFADISRIEIAGQAAAEPLYFVRDFEPYWGLRGPSVHIGYILPEDEEIEWFYNEVTVPEGFDVIGSYFMSNGFSAGYFGMQVNSQDERRVLFSVWSPYETDNPNEIPEEDRVVTLAKGEDVHIGEFGNEGSGGQSYLIYPWKAGNTYKFLTKIRPDGKDKTVFTSYFYATEESRWRLIASFQRPKTNTWYAGAYSFLENFIPEQGHLTRKVFFANQWARTSNGTWIPVSEGRFTYDNTAAAGVRQDYQGGVEGNSFYLQNGGFFNENTAYQTIFRLPAPPTEAPAIDFDKLPVN